MNKTTDQIVEQFSDPELVPHGYIDSALTQHSSSSSNLDKLHSSASQLLSQLDHYSQDLTWQLENITNELIRVSNKVSYEVELLRSDVQGLTTDLDKQSVQNVRRLESDTETVSKLKKLDKVTLRMNEVQQVFADAKAFDEDSITAEVMGLVHSGNGQNALDRLDQIYQLCQVWKGTSIYPTRMKFINELRSRIDKIVQDKNQQAQQQGKLPLSPKLQTSPTIQQQQQQQQQKQSDSYYGLFGSFTKRMGY
ncbi:hypothetical protein TRVA0_013S03092 [Trichomonascus vanleenenianus]|uniref:Golgi transport complex subunit COG7 n=1 Tax=Trichomonascus vanleenenianus TaxID=2268995 RepID=UPI003EC9ED81